MTTPMPDMPTVSVEECIRYLKGYCVDEKAASHLRSLSAECERLRTDKHFSDTSLDILAGIATQVSGIDCPKKSYADISKVLREMKARLDAAEAIVAKLPKTADGVPMIHGETYWYNGAMGDIIECHSELVVGTETCGCPTFSCYSTREAADAALVGGAKCKVASPANYPSREDRG